MMYVRSMAIERAEEDATAGATTLDPVKEEDVKAEAEAKRATSGATIFMVI